MALVVGSVSVGGVRRARMAAAGRVDLSIYPVLESRS